jgi:hypothetical protein
MLSDDLLYPTLPFGIGALFFAKGGNGGGGAADEEDADEEPDEDEDEEPDEDEAEGEGKGKKKEKGKKEGETEEEEEEAEEEEEEEEEEEDEEPFDKDRAMKLIKKLRQAERNLTKATKEQDKELKKYREAEKKSEDAKKTALQKAQDEAAEAKTRVTELEGELSDMRIRSAIERVAARMGFNDPADAYDMGDHSLLSEDKDTGKVAGVKEMLKKLAEEKPYLIDPKRATSSPERSAGGPRRKPEKRPLKRVEKHGETEAQSETEGLPPAVRF